MEPEAEVKLYYGARHRGNSLRLWTIRLRLRQHISSAGRV